MPSRLALTISGFFSTAQWALVLFVVGPFLATLLPESATGLVISVSALLTLILFPFTPRFVRLYGPRKLLLWGAVISSASALALAVFPGALAAILFIVTFFAVQPLIGYFYDLLLDASITDPGTVGRVRSLFLACANGAFILSPLLIGLLVGVSNAYDLVFIATATLFVPFALSFFSSTYAESEPPHLSHMIEVLRCLLRDRDVRAVSIAALTLQLFYQIAPIFVPVYFHTVLGIPWSELGWMFAVMLIPFLVVEYPAGWLADKVLGDQEMMAMGFLILGATFAALAFVTVLTPLVSIVIVSTLSRVGAALVEATVESHFFRRVSAKDANSIAVFRMIRPFGALIAPLMASAILFYSNFPILFFVSGLVIIIFGVGSALSIRDVR